MSDSAAGTFAISEDLTNQINNSLANGLPILVGYVNADQQARLSFRGSVHVHAPDKLALWARDPEGGLQRAISANPNLTLLYRDPATRTMIFFYGKGRFEEDPAARDAIFDATPEPEQKADPDRKGKAVIVDLDVIQGRTPDGPVNLTK